MSNKNIESTETIYILIDCDGDVCCGYDDKEFAVKEGNECGCDVEEMRFMRVKKQ